MGIIDELIPKDLEKRVDKRIEDIGVKLDAKIAPLGDDIKTLTKAIDKNTEALEELTKAIKKASRKTKD